MGGDVMRTISRVAGVVLVAGGLFLGLGAWSDPSAAAGGKGKGKGNERHPHIHAAIKSLGKAKQELKTAAHDFGGHRVAALAAVDSAITQLKTCLKFDKK
jgi:hypothetical protein